MFITCRGAILDGKEMLRTIRATCYYAKCDCPVASPIGFELFRITIKTIAIQEYIGKKVVQRCHSIVRKYSMG